MENFHSALIEASNAFRTADHLAYVSYPLLKDNKILLTIAQNLYISGMKMVDSLLHYEKFYKRINFVPSDFDSRIMMFENNLAPKMNIKQDVCKTVRELKLIIQEHKDSPVEFSRKEKLVICSDGYTIVKTIDIEMLKSYILIMRGFLTTVNKVIKNV